MGKLEFMKELFTKYGYKAQVNINKFTDGDFISATFSKSYHEYKHCCINATYIGDDIKVRYVTNGGVIPTEDTKQLEAVFRETKECEEILKALQDRKII